MSSAGHGAPRTHMAHAWLRTSAARRSTCATPGASTSPRTAARWRGRDPEALRAVACKEVPLLPGATHCFVSATITRDPKHPLGRLLGDILVLVPSATGQGKTRRIPFREEHGHHIGGTHHIALLNHPEVYERLRDWLAMAPEALPSPA